MSFLNSLRAEQLKLRKSAAFWLVLFGGLFIPAIILISRLIYRQRTVLANASEGLWDSLFHRCWEFMAIFLLPMGISLGASLIAQIEFRNAAWKQVLASPQSLHAVFWSKYVAALAMPVLFFVLFTFGVYLTGVVPAMVWSDVPFPAESFPLLELMRKNGEFFIRCLPVLAFQYLLSIHLRNFIVPVGAAFVLLVGSLIGLNWEHGHWLPYAYTALYFIRGKTGPDTQTFALGYFALFTLLNYILFLYKNGGFSGIFLQKRRTIATIAVLLLLPAPAWLYFSPSRETTLTEITINPSETADKIREFEGNLGLVKFNIVGENLAGISARMQHYGVQGMSLAVVRNYQIDWAKAWGWADAEAGIPMTVETLLQPGSISKTVNALAFLKLHEENKLDLFADVNQYLQSWQFPYDTAITHGRKITLAQLLSHSAGLNIHGFGYEGYDSAEPLPNTVQILKGEAPAKNETLRSLKQPGKEFTYSGGGTLLAQLALTDFLGGPYEEILRERVLLPLQMEESFYTQPPPANKGERLARAYSPALGQRRFSIQPEQAAAGLWTTPSDLARMMIAVQKSLAGVEGAFLSRNTARLMLTPYNDESATMGFFIQKKKGAGWFFHDAANPGFSGKFIAGMKGGNGLAVLINSDRAPALLEEVVQTIARIYGWAGFEQARPFVWKTRIKPSKDLLESIAGAYLLGTTAVHFEPENGELYMRSQQNRWKVHFTDSLGFINLESATEKKIEFDDRDRIKGIRFYRENQKPLFAPRLEERSITPADFVLLAGKYGEPDGSAAEIYAQNDRLWVRTENAPDPMQLRFLADNRFFLAENGYIFTIEQDSTGRVPLKLKGNGVELTKK